MGAGAQPDWDLWLTSVWGPSADSGAYLPGIVWLATNVVTGQNPPYYVQDFFASYPKYAGTPLTIPGATLVANSPTISLAATPPAGTVAGIPLAGPGVPDGAFIQSFTTTSPYTITMTVPASANESAVSLTTWPSPTIPYPFLLSIVNLASCNLVQQRWDPCLCGTWTLAMGLFIAHYCTLYGYTDLPPGGTYAGVNPYQIALQGYTSGIMTSKTAGDLSVGYTPLSGFGLNNWGAWNLTTYGQQLATLAKVVGMGPMFLW